MLLTILMSLKLFVGGGLQKGGFGIPTDFYRGELCTNVQKG